MEALLKRSYTKTYDWSWRDLYHRGVGMEMYLEEISPSFYGKTYTESALICFKLRVMLLAVEIRRTDEHGHMRLIVDVVPCDNCVIVRGCRAFVVGICREDTSRLPQDDVSSFDATGMFHFTPSRHIEDAIIQNSRVVQHVAQLTHLILLRLITMSVPVTFDTLFCESLERYRMVVMGIYRLLDLLLQHDSSSQNNKSEGSSKRIVIYYPPYDYQMHSSDMVYVMQHSHRKADS
ncbi:unnamed protein product [Rotaria sp. Silwood1]|nr:unnamed protein product [Rotaria sp. Silwood1]CAF4584914.1 unnamed protein product [Rotaria sp. Silwood1]